VKEQAFDNELAYMKALLDCLGNRSAHERHLKELGAGLNFFPGLPEMFDEFRAAC
jgi:hypothetical protein